MMLPGIEELTLQQIENERAGAKTNDPPPLYMVFSQQAEK